MGELHMPDEAVEAEKSAVEMRRNLRAVIWHVALTFALSEPYLYLLFSYRCPSLDEMTEQTTSHLFSLRTLVGLPAVWMPAICALLVTRFVLHENWRTTTLNRLGHKRYYIWAWLLCPALTLIIVWLSVLSGLAKFDPNMFMAQIAGYEFGGATDLRRSFLLQLLPAAIFLPGFWSVHLLGEEIGWRGFLLPRLMKAGLGQWGALILSGAIWGLWHAPLPLSGCAFTGHPILGILVFVLSLILFGIVFGWLMLASRSVWVPAVAHAALDTISRRVMLLLDPQFNFYLVGSEGSLLGWGVYTVFIAWLAWTGRLPVRSREVSGLLGSVSQPEGQYGI
jgi:uncharacterized protein